MKKHLESKEGAHTSEYNIWQAMLQRCNNPNNAYYHRYGGRGIEVSDEWTKDYTKFLEDVGRRPSKEYSLDRIDNDGNYCKENCRWATKEEQGNNTVKNHFVTVGDETLSLSQWARRLKCSRHTVLSRIKFGWSEEDAVSKPVKCKLKKNEKAEIKLLYSEGSTIKELYEKFNVSYQTICNVLNKQHY